ncbi:hypothetical protein Ahy_A07g035827 [Arachis hypogaea]|uniref:Xylanase inhibitor N-terminal domain-containing protein n=1 Tax=Arachis hypogaea TaxID=3818 RepID=A0A445CEH7_ARAHY|nr:hypothetical protein Ahy_A07g035827 [Arachis hypogaea]
MKGTGIVGLGAWPLSLVSQLGDRIGHKFSYCLAPIDSNSNSKLKFGDEANILGNGVVSTRLTKNPISPSYYNVKPKGINVVKVPITFTYLDRKLYNDIVTSMKQIYSSVEAVQDLPQSFDFCGCFKGSSVEVPSEIVFHFNGGDVTLPLENMYTIVENNLMNFQVEYDLQGKRVSFAPSNCADNSGLIIISFCIKIQVCCILYVHALHGIRVSSSNTFSIMSEKLDYLMSSQAIMAGDL